MLQKCTNYLLNINFVISYFVHSCHCKNTIELSQTFVAVYSFKIGAVLFLQALICAPGPRL